MTEATAARDLDITGVTCDSRRVEPGYLFAAIPGAQLDGRDYIPDAIRRGAIAVLGPPGTGADEVYQNVSVIIDDDPRRLYALMAAGFFESQPKTIAAVTGTSGKTSTVHFLRQIWNAMGLRAAALGTLGLRATDPKGGSLLPTTEKALTTPDAADLHRQLRELTELNIDHLAMEASSHGLDQRRLDGVRVSAAAFSNLSHDHLDYHGTEAAYLDAKLRLFSDLLIDGGAAVINADQTYAETAIAVCRGRGLPVMTYGENGDRVQLVKTIAQPDGQQLTLNIDGATHHALLPLVGDFQASNALCAVSLAIAIGADPDTVVGALSDLHGAPGRMERIGMNATGATVYVDYAHKPAALELMLKALRPHTRARLAVVFGCGGDRDTAKRPEMGRIADTYADVVYVTDDNPRGEAAASIRREILQGCPTASEIGDRTTAIASAINQLNDGDVLVVAGKGHETGQIVGDEILPFNDADAVRKIVGGGP